jgi:hypothetical protein
MLQLMMRGPKNEAMLIKAEEVIQQSRNDQQFEESSNQLFQNSTLNQNFKFNASNHNSPTPLFSNGHTNLFTSSLNQPQIN